MTEKRPIFLTHKLCGRCNKRLYSNEYMVCDDCSDTIKLEEMTSDQIESLIGRYMIIKYFDSRSVIAKSKEFIEWSDGQTRIEKKLDGGFKVKIKEI